MVNYFNDMMDELSTFKPLAMESSMVTIFNTTKGQQKLLIPLMVMKRPGCDYQIFNDFVKPDYEVRWFAESLNDDTLGFTVLSGTNG